MSTHTLFTQISGSQRAVHGSLEVSETLGGSLQSQNYFHNAKMFLSFFGLVTFVPMVQKKPMVNKAAGALAK